MRRLSLIIAVLFFACVACAEERKVADDPSKLFYSGNSHYEKREYEKALEAYLEILKTGLASGGLYYNIGNAYFKLGKVGYALVYYEKARRIMPQDADLKANMKYAESLIESVPLQPKALSFAARLIRAGFGDFNLNAITIMTMTAYLLVIALTVLFIFKPYEARKFRFFYAVSVGLLFWSLAVFSMRYYWEVGARHAIVVQKRAECKYEPIENSSTYFTLSEGEIVTVQKAYGDWDKIRVPDGRTAWTKSSAVEEI